MGLSQALSTGVSGLMSHQKALDNIGNNLANVNTTGYKKGIYQFSTLLEQSLRGGMSASGNRGSVNPIALGMGTQTGSINKIFSQGTLETTGATNDMAIWGNGFFVVSTGGGYALTRDGSFYVSEDGYLMGGNGLYVQGTMAVRNADGSMSIPQDAKLQNISIPLGSTGGMSKTSEVSFSGNLKSTQKVSSGLKLFGSFAPSSSNLQAWMDTGYNSTDTTWKALESESFVVSQEMLDVAAGYGANLPGGMASNVSTYTGGFVPTSSYHALNTATGLVEEVYGLDADGNKIPVSTTDLLDGTYGAGTAYIPVTQEINTINGGNVQTSAALGITVPSYLTRGTVVEYNGTRYAVNNDYTYPAWFYDANGGDFAAVVSLGNSEYLADVGAGWPNGFQGSATQPTAVPSALSDLPRAGETYAATLDTPLEHLYYNQGNKWTQMFPNIKDGDEVTIGFDKGNSHVEATFVYNRPSGTAAFGNQVSVDYENSCTLEHLLQFMGGDVDQAATACAAITPAMFGAPITADFPDGDPNGAGFDSKAYNDALANYTLAKSGANTNTSSTGVMGLIDVAANIGAANGGTDDYDSPAESAGAFTREGLSQVSYQRWNSVTNDYETVSADSFNISFVSNLGTENALSNISFAHNSVTHKTVFAAETEYSAPQGGYATTTVTAYDSLGNPKVITVRLSLVSEDSNFSTWRWYADCEDDSDFTWQADPLTGELTSSLNVGTGLIRFDSDGNFVSGSDCSETGGIMINLANQGVDDLIQIQVINGLGSSTLQDLDFSKLTFTAADNDFSLLEQNGNPPGTLESYTVASDGTINGVYSTGQVIPVARLILATVANENGLTAAGDNLYYVTPASGDAQYGFPELGGRGEIRQYQLETSTVDMSEEFTRMIAIERGYQANSRIITTADEMLQELLSMVR